MVSLYLKWQICHHCQSCKWKEKLTGSICSYLTVIWFEVIFVKLLSQSQYSNGMSMFFSLICNITFNISGRILWNIYKTNILYKFVVCFYHFLWCFWPGEFLNNFIEKHINLFLLIFSFSFILRKSFFTQGSDQSSLTLFLVLFILPLKNLTF